jgi:DNA-binding NarL/FixJ family response regulator
MIRLLLVDDHPIVREGLEMVLQDEPDLEVVGAADTAEQAIELVRTLQPDVVLLDLELPGMSGIEAIPALVAAGTDTQILVFTAYDSDERVFGAVRSGARGYLLKGAPATEIARAVRSAARGESYLEPRVATRLLQEVRAPRRFTGLLTERERSVLRLVAAGESNKQIARTLSISERTVKFHVTSIFRKLEVENRAQAVAVAAQRGLL